MAMTSTRGALWRVVDQLTLTRLSIYAAALIIVPAFFYWLLSSYTASSYLEQGGSADKNFLDAVYFSFVNAVTVGSQDLVPHGWTRLILCLQVTGGLALAGLAIAKLTSVHGRQMRSAIHNAEGTWIEPCILPGGQVLVSLSRFYEEDGALCYGGENFDINGKPMGFFSSQFISSSQMILKFNYSNHGTCPDYFGDGVTNHWFVKDPVSGLWNRHHATCKDFDRALSFPFEGYRATVDEVKIIHGTDLEARTTLIRSYVERAKRSAGQPAEAAPPAPITAQA